MDWQPSCGRISALAKFVSEHAEGAGYPRLAQAGKSTVWRILNEYQIKPHKIRYYLERRDPEFDRKMAGSVDDLSRGLPLP
jgi:hypothetical protein